MLGDDPLLDEFRRLQAESDRKRRGYGLEKLVARMFRRAHFRVKPNAGMAKPRQTDLVAEGGGHVFLVETKWTTRSSSIAEIDSLRARLEKTHSSVVGVLISVSGFSRQAIEAVGARRDRPMLLIDGKDIEEACKRDADLRRILRNKLDALLLDGDVLVGERLPSRQRRTASGDPVDGDAYLLMRDDSRVPWIHARGSFSGFTFSRGFNDPDWVPAAGAGVTFDLSLSIHTVADVALALSELSSLGWATGAGHWSIAQSEANWHGIGPANLVQALLCWKERYRDAGSIHHTEQVVYQDVCDDGFYTLMIDVDAYDPRLVWRSDMSLQLSGIPLDLDPIRELCRTFDVQARTRFRPRTDKMLKRVWLRQDQTEVKPVAFVVNERTWPPDRRPMVCGLVVENPYYAQKAQERGLADEMPRPLEETEFLVCVLGSWHQLGKKLKYRLDMCEWAETSDALVARVVVDWLDPRRRGVTTADRRPRRKRSR
ncbi:MAG: restriction endonuclease [Solirubrobacteraceae bacterium]